MHRLDDLRSLRAKVDGKAHDLFKAKDGVASLQVTQVFRDRRANCSVGSIQTGAFVQDQDVWNLGEIRALRNVIVTGLSAIETWPNDELGLTQLSRIQTI
ncbi:MAG: hypothetical protein CL912_14375 [Deltaproteobacteria bacterium]|nr:hypothetical protein [Deltaproteobacteria bacterium]